MLLPGWWWQYPRLTPMLASWQQHLPLTSEYQLLIRSNFEIISLISFGWKPKAVLQQNINPTYEDILLRGDYPHQNKAVDRLDQTLHDPPVDSAEVDPVTPTLLPSGPPTADFPVSDTAIATRPISAKFSPDLTPTPPPHRYPIHEYRVPSHLACNLSTTKTSLSISTSEPTEFCGSARTELTM